MIGKQNNLADICSLLSSLYILEFQHILNTSDTGITKYNLLPPPRGERGSTGTTWLTEEVLKLDFWKCYTLLRKLTNEIFGNDI